jgi:23S rRNA pseudouridine2605 synthase
VSNAASKPNARAGSSRNSKPKNATNARSTSDKISINNVSTSPATAISPRPNLVESDESTLALDEGWDETAFDEIEPEGPEQLMSVAEAPEAGEIHSESEDAERLQKLMARAGVASRRAAEDLIKEGRVSVNGHVITELGAKADPWNDRILVDGKPLHVPQTTTVVVLHKPRGVVTTKDDPEGRTTVMQMLPARYKTLHPVGRLDFDTSGLLLLTDDGELTQLLTHPSHGVPKVYYARVRGKLQAETIRRLQEGIYLDDGKTAPCRVRVRAETENNSLVEITLHEGRNRQVRRMLDAVGHQVSALRRVKFGSIGLMGLPAGGSRELLPGEVHMLRKDATKKTKIKPAPATAKPKVRRVTDKPKGEASEKPAPLLKKSQVAREARRIERAAAYNAQKQEQGISVQPRAAKETRAPKPATKPKEARKSTAKLVKDLRESPKPTYSKEARPANSVRPNFTKPKPARSDDPRSSTPRSGSTSRSNAPRSSDASRGNNAASRSARPARPTSAPANGAPSKAPRARMAREAGSTPAPAKKSSLARRIENKWK